AFKRLTSLVIGQRIKVDPLLWQRCNFIYEPDGEEEALVRSLEPLAGFIRKTGQEGPEAITPEFKEKMAASVFELVTLANMGLEQSK
ncbi:MAG: hypothetical protein GWN58_43810, partial [Anaerolineae bacterium]|nr:hypothetical protein [Anaerolineae bacterium]